MPITQDPNPYFAGYNAHKAAKLELEGLQKENEYKSLLMAEYQRKAAAEAAAAPFEAQKRQTEQLLREQELKQQQMATLQKDAAWTAQNILPPLQAFKKGMMTEEQLMQSVRGIVSRSDLGIDPQQLEQILAQGPQAVEQVVQASMSVLDQMKPPPAPPKPYEMKVGDQIQYFDPITQQPIPGAGGPRFKPHSQSQSNAAPYYSPFDSPYGAMIFNHRTGQMVPATVDGKKVVKSSSDPGLQRDLASAKKAGEGLGKREINMAGLGETIAAAEQLLTGADGGALPTGSGIGAGFDYVSAIFGYSPAGAEKAQALKAVAGALTAKMPRMEGPQSDKDVQLYREMAAVVGDSTVPRARRIDALGQVKKLWAKYESQQPGSSQPSPAPSEAPPSVDPAVWNVMTPDERALWTE